METYYSPIDGGELSLGDDGYYHSDFSDQLYEIYDGVPVALKDRASGDDLIINDQGNLTNLASGASYFRERSASSSLVELKDPISGGTLEMGDDGSYVSESTGQRFEFDENNSRFIPLYIPDDTLEGAHVEGNELVANETGRRFPIMNDGVPEMRNIEQISEDNSAFDLWYSKAKAQIEQKVNGFEEVSNEMRYFGELESKRISGQNDEETQKYFKEYLNRINNIFESTNSSVHSNFNVQGNTCIHTLEQMDDTMSSVLLCGVFSYDEEFKRGLMVPAIIDYSRRNELDSIEVSANPRRTSVYNVNSYSSSGNILTISNVDARFAKEIKYNAEMIPPELYQPKENAQGLELTSSSGFVAMIELCILTFVVTLVFGIVLAIEMMS